jgi:glycosyltransferase involved in cell wall biosynthesis
MLVKGLVGYMKNAIRILYSFPHRIGTDRICYTAWQQVEGLAAAGAEILLCPSSLGRAVSHGVKVWPTLARGKLRIPYRLIGSMRAFALHDYIVSRRIERLADQVDIIHVWPLGALRTIKIASHLGIPTVLERPNAHTRFAYEAVMKECERLGVVLPADHEHAFKEDVLAKEEEEYELANRLLCPSDFVVRTFLDRGFSSRKLAQHQYGFDEKAYHPISKEPSARHQGLRMLFVGGGAPRKGVHFAAEAWLKSTAARTGTFLIAGQFVPEYAKKLSSLLAHPSIQMLGHRTDVPDLMRKSDILVLPSIEEGSALVTYEARGSGCVLLVSDAAGAICHHFDNALVHHAGDVQELADQISMLNEDRILLSRLRTSSLSTVQNLTWSAAGARLLAVYRETIAMHSSDINNERSSQG